MCGHERPKDDLIGSTLGGRYVIREQLGSGTTGAVYRAEHVNMDRQVAVKILHADHKENELVVERFRRQATNLGNVANEHLVNIFDFGQSEDGRLFFVMEYLEGETLAARIARVGRLAPAHACSILVQVARALMEPHAMGYVHRDLSASNVFLCPNGKDDRVKLIDFGLGKLMTGTERIENTRLGLSFGDPRYMSPEQLLGEDLDQRSDIYSIGVLLFECLTGTVPYQAPAAHDIVEGHLRGKIPRVSDCAMEIPSALDDVVQLCLAKKPTERFSTLSRFVDALKHAAGTLVGYAGGPTSSSQGSGSHSFAQIEPEADDSSRFHRSTSLDLGTTTGLSGDFFAAGQDLDNGAPQESSESLFGESPDPRPRREAWLLGGFVLVAGLVVFLIMSWAKSDLPNNAIGALDAATSAAANSGAASPAVDATSPAPTTRSTMDAAPLVQAQPVGDAVPLPSPRHADSRPKGTPSEEDRAPGRKVFLPANPQRDPEDLAKSDFFNKVGLQYLAQEKWEEATEQFDKARRFDPQSVIALSGLGRAALAKRDYRTALVHLNKALEFDPQSADIYIWRGNAFLSMGRKMQARHSFQRALSLRPDSDEARRGFKEVEGAVPIESPPAAHVMDDLE